MHICKKTVEEFVLNWIESSLLLKEPTADVPFEFTEIKKIQPYSFTLTSSGQTIAQSSGIFYFGDINLFTFFDSPATALSKMISVNIKLNGNQVAGAYNKPAMIFTGETEPVATYFQIPNEFTDVIFDSILSQGDSTIYFRGWKIELK